MSPNARALIASVSLAMIQLFQEGGFCVGLEHEEERHCRISSNLKFMKGGSISSVRFSSVTQLCRLFETPWTTALQASLSITNSRSLLKLMSIELVMPSNHLILCRSLLLTPSLFPGIRVFSNELLLCIRWPKYWSFSINPSSEYSRLISFRGDWLDSPCSPRDSQESSLTPQFKIQKHQFFSAQLSL